MEIRESQIEDILVSAPVLTKNILRLEDEPRFLCRQMIMPSGRLDLLYTYHTELLLLELKVVPFKRQFVEQLSSYRNDLLKMQEDGDLIQGRIRTYLLVTKNGQTRHEPRETDDVKCVVYDPAEVLNYFYKNMKPIALFTETKPIDIGIWNIHLIHNLLYSLEGGITSVKELRKDLGGSPRTLYNKIKFAYELRLIDWSPNEDAVLLTNLGREYCKCKDSVLPVRLSESQAALIRSFVMSNPYQSSVILGIASAVEAVFALSKNTYPVPMTHMMAYFTFHAGKYFDWQTDKAKYNATRMYTNYATDLGLLGKTNDNIYLTPEGIRFTVQMQLHKGLKLVESMKIL
jgi:DNA-binding MarR family transcriptional regulator